MNPPTRLPTILFLSFIAALTTAQADLAQAWIRQYGTSAADVANALTVDAAGQIWVTGYTAGSLGAPNAGSSDIFLSRLSPSGTVDFSRQRGGSSSDVGRGVAVAGNGTIFISGVTGSTLDGTVPMDAYDNYAMRYDGSGTWLGTVRTGSNALDQAEGVAANATHLLAAGWTAGSFDGQVNGGGYDAFLTKRDSAGTLVWTRFAGAGTQDFGQSATFDSAGNAYLVGKTFSSFSGFTNKGSGDIFVARYDAAGTRTFLTQFGIAGDDNAADIKVDASGNIYIAGYTHGPFGSYDSLLTKLDSLGNVLWTQYLGGAGDDQSRGLALDAAGHVWIGGSSSSSFGGHTNAGGSDAFVAEYDTAGNLLATTFLATASDDRISGLTMSPDGAVLVAGYTAGNLGGVNAGNGDIFVARIIIVPEPSATLLLIGPGLLLLQRRRR